jgi:hypothetical protein
VSVKGLESKKSCPRCGANIFLDGDQYGWFEHCLRCGHTRDLPAVELKPGSQYSTGRALSRETK